MNPGLASFLIFSAIIVLLQVSCDAKPIHFPLKKVDFGADESLKQLYRLTSSYNRYLELMKISPPNLPLGGSISLLPTGAYFVQVAVGTPPQKVLALLDSGSNDFLVTTTECVGCNKTANTEYNYAASSSVEKLDCSTTKVTCPKCVKNTCEFFNQYITCAPNNPEQPCIMEGPILGDVFSVEGTDLSVSVYFGAITFMNITFPGPMSALWGVAANQNYTTFGETGPLDALYQKGLIDDMFSVCILQENGTFTLGGMDSGFYSGDLNWTPILSKAAFVIETVDMLIDGKSLGFPPSKYNQEGGSVVDTGTYSLVVPSIVYDTIAERLFALCSTVNLVGVCGIPRSESIFYSGKCFNMTSDDISAFPDMGIVFGGNVSVTVAASAYLVPDVSVHTCQAWGLQDGGKKALTLHGDVVLKNKYVVFDKTNMRLGWADNINYAACMSAQPATF